MKKQVDMLNFTVGPVMSSGAVRRIGGEQVPYFRTPEFSELTLDSEGLIKQFAHAEDSARVLFLTGSGTAAMEATVMNALIPSDRVLVVNGGSFGHRFVQLCEIHGLDYSEIKVPMGKQLTELMLEPFAGQGFTAFLVNVGETSTGVHYDMELISRFCQEQGLLLVVDAISSFLADPLDMESLHVDVMITGSQKALACAPGVSVIVLGERAVGRVEDNRVRSMYFDLKDALKNAERGQTPFTPAVGILRQINVRLHEIADGGGAAVEIERTRLLAEDFRQHIRHLPLEPFAESPSNALTSLHPLHVSAYDVFVRLKDEYGIWICPNGGELRDRVFRVGHIGALTVGDNMVLVEALNDLHDRGML
uniref:Alanine--glyoxylate aminotransferase family protein n=1 Tax=Prevotella sp. GTC17254 TaxID=3236794 RepID=A0AB33IZ86_9BACT